VRNGTWVYTGGKRKSAQKKYKPKRILQFKIALKGIEPAIWRRIRVGDDMNLRTFAVALLLAMGWKNSHLHEFVIGGKHYGMMTEEAEDMLDEMPMEDETKYGLKDLSEKHLKKFVFLYDFGDGWQHDVVFEGVFQPEPRVFYPGCIDGARNCPPEDCGGTGGYRELAEKLKKPDDEEYEELIEWLGGKYDTEFFDLSVINSTLKKTDAYERYGFEHDESAGDVIFEDEYVNCGIGTAVAGKFHENKTGVSSKKRRSGKRTAKKKQASNPMSIWDNLKEGHKRLILDSVYCVKCTGATTIKDYTFHPEGKCLVIRGKCLKCGHEAARVLEGE